MLKNYKKVIALITTFALILTTGFSSMPVKAVDDSDNASKSIVENNEVKGSETASDSDVKTIQILSTTDSHGKFMNYDYALNGPAAGGLNQVAAAVKKAKSENPNTLVIDNGDTIQGNYNSMFLTDEFLDNNTNPMVLAINKIGYDVENLGNHEFNFGIDTLNKVISQYEKGGTTVLCGNLYKDGQRVYKPYTVKEVDGVRVAIIGVVAPNITNWDKDKLAGYEATNPAKEVQKILDEIKSKDEADLYVVSAHMGENTETNNGDSAAEIANLNPEVSLIIAGHSHVRIAQEYINGVLVTQPKNAGEDLSKAELKVKKNADGKYEVVEKTSSVTTFTKTSETDAELDEALAPYDEMAKADGKKKIGTLIGSDLAEPNEVKGISQSFVSDQGVTDLINEVQLYYSDKQLASIGIDTSKIHHVTGSAMLSATANLYSGDITKSDLSNIYKFDNKLYTVKTTGKQIKKYLEWTAGLFETFEEGDLTVSLNPKFATYLYDTLSGVNYNLNISKEVGNRVENLTFPDGSKVNDTDEIYLTVNDYRLNSCLNKVFDADEVEEVYKSTNDSLSDVRDMISDYIQNVKKGEISRNVDNNWSLTGVNYENKALRDEVVNLINNDTITLTTHLKAADVIKQLKDKGLTEEAAKIESLNAAAKNKTIDVLSFNDFHGNALESGKNVGAAKLTGVIKEYQSKETSNYGVIPVSGGDIFQGTAISNLTQGEPEIEMMKAMGVEVSAVGNHEFDWGIDNFKTWQEDGNFKFLAGNMIDEKTGEPVNYVEPYKIIEKNGIKIAFIGLATEETLTSTKAENTVGLKFADYVETLNKYIPIVKAEGADAIVALTHCGSYQDETTGEITGEGAELAKAGVEGLDAIITAHSHKFVSGKVNDTPVVQAGYNGRGLSKLSFTFDENNKLVSVEAETTKFQGNESTLPVDAEVAAKMEKLQEKLSGILGEHVTTLENRLNNDDKYSNLTELGVKVSETMRLVAGTQVAVNNGGGIRRSLEAGEVTVGDMYEILPFDNYVETMEIKGSELKRVIQYGINPENIGWGQYAGIKVYYNPDTYEINSMTLLDGTPIEDDEYYTLATNDFMVTGGDGYDFSGARNIKNTNICMRDSIMDYWKANGVPAGETNLLIAGEAPVIDDNNQDSNNTGNNSGNNTSQNGGAAGTDTIVTDSDKNNDSTNNNKNNTVGKESAKTGDNVQIEMLAILTLAAFAGVAYTVRRRKEA